MQKYQQVDIAHLQSPNHDINITHLKKCLMQSKKLPIKFIQNLIKRFMKLVENEPNILNKSQPVTIIGDIHGQFRDLSKIISLCPNLQENPKHTLLFLGDYVDRGPFGIQVVLLLMAMKINNQKQVFMLRGNHESRQMSQCFNFFSETCEKYNQDIYFLIMNVFDCLPLGCIVDEKYFCVHGGVSPKALEIAKINKENRKIQIPLEGVMCDLLWADPSESPDGATGSLADPNYMRNCSIIFGRELGQMFLKKNSLITIIRAHEVQMEGFKEHCWPGWKNIPTVYTVFSAPNYCGTYRNKAAILNIVVHFRLIIQNNQFKIRQFKEEDPKYFVPEKYDAFNFSTRKIAAIVHGLCIRMAKFKTKSIPQLKDVPDEQVLQLLIGYVKQQKYPVRQFVSAAMKKQGNKKKSGQSDSFYSKSLIYFKNSEKRNSQSQIMTSKNKSVKLSK